MTVQLLQLLGARVWHQADAAGTSLHNSSSTVVREQQQQQQQRPVYDPRPPHPPVPAGVGITVGEELDVAAIIAGIEDKEAQQQALATAAHGQVRRAQAAAPLLRWRRCRLLSPVPLAVAGSWQLPLHCHAVASIHVLLHTRTRNCAPPLPQPPTRAALAPACMPHAAADPLPPPPPPPAGHQGVRPA
jgi:hypothetical protein